MTLSKKEIKRRGQRYHNALKIVKKYESGIYLFASVNAKKAGASIDLLRGNNRKREIVYIRMVIARLLFVKYPMFPLAKTAMLLNLSRSVIYYYKNNWDNYKTFPEVIEIIEKIINT